MLIKTFFDIKEMYEKHQQRKIEKHYSRKTKAIKRITKEVENATTDKQREEFARRLSSLTNS